jgi:hypothetical protein
MGRYVVFGNGLGMMDGVGKVENMVARKLEEKLLGDVLR